MTSTNSKINFSYVALGVALLPFLVVGLPGTECVPTERERHLLVLQGPSAVLAVHNPRLVGMQFQPDLSEPTTDRLPHLAGLAFGHAVDHRIVCEPLELDARIFPGHPGGRVAGGNLTRRLPRIRT